MNDRLVRLKDARSEMQEAARIYRDVIAHTFKPGDEVLIQHGRSEYWATVAPRENQRRTYCTAFDRLWVRGEGGAQYWVGAHRVIDLRHSENNLVEKP